MILDCPKCSAKYNIADSAIPSEGRNVRCAACGHFWFQKPATALVVTEEAGENTERMRFQEEAKSTFADRKTKQGRKINEKSSRYENSRAPHEQYRDKIFSKARISNSFAIATAWGLALAILGAVILYGVVNRETIVKKWPKSATFFALLGTRANMYGLEINKVQVRVGQDTEGPRLVVAGTVHSTSQTPKTLPYLRVTLVNEKGVKTATWLVDPGTTIISPMAEQPFETIRRPIPDGKLRAIVTFADPPRELPSGQAVASTKHDTLLGDASQQVISPPLEIEAKEIKTDAHATASNLSGADNKTPSNAHNAQNPKVENPKTLNPKILNNEQGHDAPPSAIGR